MNHLEILKKYWGYDSFRGVQAQIIESISSGKDTLGLMPTGGGKSVTFQVPALGMEGLCLVITPLIALMKDQVQHLRKRHIKAQAIYSGMSFQQIQVALENCMFGQYKFLYVSPERLESEYFLQKIKLLKICFITVDESHCISQWGYDFRPSYLHIAQVRQLLPNVPVLALTATATPRVVKDIQRLLHFKQENVFSQSFERKNLGYVVRRTNNKLNELLHILHGMPGSAIVYTRNRKRTREICEFLKHEKISATFYHAGLDHATREVRQQQWQRDEVRVMVATNAFGMGIDKPDVRLVVHLDVPDAIESYFQEAGRAGRDGQRAYAVLLFNEQDRANLHRRVSDNYPEKDYIRQVYENVQFYYQMAVGDGKGCRKMFDVDDFCRHFHYFPVPVESSLRILTQAGYLDYNKEPDTVSRIMFLLKREELYRLQGFTPETELIIQTLLRNYTGLFTDYAYISEELLAQRTGFERPFIYERLIYLAQQHVVSYIPMRKLPTIGYPRERVEKDDIIISKDIYEARKKNMEERIEKMLEYIDDNVSCRSRMLLDYFGEKNPHNCGICDTCVEHRKNKR